MIGVDRPALVMRFHVRGPWLIGVAVVQGPGAPVVIRARANIANLEKLYRRILLTRQAAGGAAVGFWGSIKKAFKKIKRAVVKVAKGKIVKSIAKAARGVMKSPITKYALAATAVAFPAVGIPAMAALAASNKILDGVERGSKAARAAVKKLTRLARGRTPRARKARKALKILTTTNQWRKGLRVAQSRGMTPAALHARRRALRTRMLRRRAVMRRRLAAARRRPPRLRKRRPTPRQLAALRRATPAQLAALRRMVAARRRVRGVGAINYPAIGAAVGGACECG